MDKHTKKFKDDIMYNIVQLTVKRDFLEYKFKNGGLVDNSEQNKAKVETDIQALTDKIRELQEMYDFVA